MAFFSEQSVLSPQETTGAFRCENEEDAVYQIGEVSPRRLIGKYPVGGIIYSPPEFFYWARPDRRRHIRKQIISIGLSVRVIWTAINFLHDTRYSSLWIVVSTYTDSFHEKMPPGFHNSIFSGSIPSGKFLLAAGHKKDRFASGSACLPDNRIDSLQLFLHSLYEKLP